MKFTATARTLGIFSAAATVILLVAYAVTLTVGLASLESPQQPMGDPIFTILEVLIIVLMPAMVALIVAVHAWAPMQAKTLTLTSLEAAPIGGQLFAHDNSQRDCTAFRLLLDTYATRLLAQALSLHGLAGRGDIRRALLRLDPEPPARVRRAAVGVAGLPVRVALGRVRRGHPRLGCLLPALSAIRRPRLPGEPLGRMDTGTDDRKRGALACRPERGGGRRHAAAEHRHSRLRRSVPRRGSPVSNLVLQSDTARGLAHATTWRSSVVERLSLMQAGSRLFIHPSA